MASYANVEIVIPVDPIDVCGNMIRDIIFVDDKITLAAEQVAGVDITRVGTDLGQEADDAVLLADGSMLASDGVIIPYANFNSTEIMTKRLRRHFPCDSHYVLHPLIPSKGTRVNCVHPPR